MLLTTQQVKEQQQSFDCFIKSVNLSKIGKIIIKHISAGDSLHYEFVRKVLYNAKIRPAMYHPTLNRFYSNILMSESISAFLNSCKK